MQSFQDLKTNLPNEFSLGQKCSGTKLHYSSPEKLRERKKERYIAAFFLLEKQAFPPNLPSVTVFAQISLPHFHVWLSFFSPFLQLLYYTYGSPAGRTCFVKDAGQSDSKTPTYPTSCLYSWYSLVCIEMQCNR